MNDVQLLSDLSFCLTTATERRRALVQVCHECRIHRLTFYFLYNYICITVHSQVFRSFVHLYILGSRLKQESTSRKAQEATSQVTVVRQSTRGRASENTDKYIE